MQNNQVNMWLSMNAENFRQQDLVPIRNALEAMPNERMMYLQSTSFKKPSTIFLIAFLLGWERFMLDDVGLGIVKVITGYGCGIWWLIDLFSARERARKYNFQQFQKVTSFFPGGNVHHSASASASVTSANAGGYQSVPYQAGPSIPTQVVSSNPQNFSIPASQPQDAVSGEFMKNMLNRVKQLLFSPQTEYQTIEQGNEPHTQVMTHYVLPLMVVPVLFAFIGYGLIGYSFGGHHFNEVTLGLRWAAEQIVLLLGGIYITTLIINAQANKYGTMGDFNRAFALVAYAYTPMFFAGIFHIWHGLSWLVYAVGIYGLYLLITGLKPMMKPADEKAGSYAATSWIVAVAVFVVLMKVLEAIILPSMPFMPSIPSFQYLLK